MVKFDYDNDDDDEYKFHSMTGLVGPDEESRYCCTLSLASSLDMMGVQRHVPAALPPIKTRNPLNRRLGGENFTPSRIRSPDNPACSESLYRLRSPGPQ